MLDGCGPREMPSRGSTHQPTCATRRPQPPSGEPIRRRPVRSTSSGTVTSTSLSPASISRSRSPRRSPPVPQAVGAGRETHDPEGPVVFHLCVASRAPPCEGDVQVEAVAALVTHDSTAHGTTRPAAPRAGRRRRVGASPRGRNGCLRRGRRREGSRRLSVRGGRRHRTRRTVPRLPRGASESGPR